MEHYHTKSENENYAKRLLHAEAYIVMIGIVVSFIMRIAGMREVRLAEKSNERGRDPQVLPRSRASQVSATRSLSIE